MSPFIAGAIFGALFAGAILSLFITLLRRRAHEPDEWPPQFEEPAPVMGPRALIIERIPLL